VILMDFVRYCPKCGYNDLGDCENGLRCLRCGGEFKMCECRDVMRFLHKEGQWRCYRCGAKVSDGGDKLNYRELYFRE